jgi:uncharacterized protein YbjT (DUF2867 family)
MRILLTGASGFIGSTLAPRLLAEGHEVCALTREPGRVRSAISEASEIEVITGDVLTGVGLERAMESVGVAYYLIHSMESPLDGARTHGSFPERERVGARNFAAAARHARVERIVYLGGLLPRHGSVSPHLASRAEVEEILLAHVPASVALRASIVIGAHSRSFRLLVQLVERLPVLTLPAWRRFHTQPIDARDAIEMLAAAARLPTMAGRHWG